MVSPALAVGSGHEFDPSQDQGWNPPAVRGQGTVGVVEHLNPVLRGWGNYFRTGNSARKFSQIDSYVHERLAILASTKYALSGRNWATRFDGTWFRRLGVYTLTGTVRYGTAHALR